MPFLVIDIETVANEHAPKYFASKRYTPASKLAEIDSPPKAITGLKNEELREERLTLWRLEQQQKLDDSVNEQRARDFDKAALKWWTGKVICICGYNMATDEESKFTNLGDERALLNDFFNFLEKGYSYSVPVKEIEQSGTHPYQLIGKETKDFDLPYLRGRAIALNTGVPDTLRVYNEQRLQDINDLLGFSSTRSQRGRLNDYAWGIQMAGKLRDGGDVASMYDDGAAQEIEDYCMQDVYIPTEILRRYLKPFLPEGY